jgi:hypothetical protein
MKTCTLYVNDQQLQYPGIGTYSLMQLGGMASKYFWYILLIMENACFYYTVE